MSGGRMTPGGEGIPERSHSGTHECERMRWMSARRVELLVAVVLLVPIHGSTRLRKAGTS